MPHPIRNVRQGQYGPEIRFTSDFTNLDRYTTRIEEGTKTRILTPDYELHDPVRFKRNTDLKKLPGHGVKYLELQMLDLDPSSSIGVRTDMLRFIRLLVSYLVM